MPNLRQQFKEDISRAQEKHRKGKRLTKHDKLLLALSAEDGLQAPPRPQYAKNAVELAEILNIDVKDVRHYEKHKNAPRRLVSGAFPVDRWSDFLATVNTLEEVELLPWDQQPGEPSLWFERFTYFRLLPPDQRTLVATYKHFRSSGKLRQSKPFPNTQKGPIRAPIDWSSNAQQFGWISRAERWDAHLLRTVNQVEEDKIQAEREKQIKGANKIRDKALQALESKSFGAFSVFDALSGFAMANKEIRLAFPGLMPQPRGDEPTGPVKGVVIMPPMEDKEP